MGKPPCFMLFFKEIQDSWFPFCFPGQEIHSKKGQLVKEKNCSEWSKKEFAPNGTNSFFYKLTPIKMGGKGENDRYFLWNCAHLPERWKSFCMLFSFLAYVWKAWCPHATFCAAESALSKVLSSACRSVSHLPHRFSLRQTSIRQISRKNGTLSQLLAPSMLISEKTNGLLTKHAKTKVLLFKTNLYIFKSTVRKTHCHVLVQIKYLQNMFSFIHRQITKLS